MSKRPLILNITANNDFMAQVESRLPTLFQVESITTLEQLAPLRTIHKNGPAEPVYGFDSDIYAALVERQPALILFDFDQDAILWHKWIPIIKASPATRRIPIVGHTAELSRELRQKAKTHGTDSLIPQERLLADLPQLVTSMVRTVDTKEIEQACAQPLPEKSDSWSRVI